MEVVMHRFVLAEFNTHRKFSRNSASSRAIPARKQLERVMTDPAWPIEWPAEQKGMQGGELLQGVDLINAQTMLNKVWLNTCKTVASYLSYPDGEKLHKSLINRLLEPFMWHTVVVSSTEWDNFFAQRCSTLAQPEIRAVAKCMEEALSASKPQKLMEGGWHYPYINQEELYYWDWQTLVKLSVARCARVSYLTHDGKRDPQADLDLYEKLVSADPGHWSPCEHVARVNPNTFHNGNFDVPFEQWRKVIEK